MTNPISKAIVKAAVAMGYGKKSDYKGSSVADVLEKFAAIAKDKGGSGGGAVYATFTEDNGTWACDKTYAELKAAYDAGNVILAQYSIGGELTIATPMALTENEQVSALVARYTTIKTKDFAGVHFLNITLMNSTATVFGNAEELVCKMSDA